MKTKLTVLLVLVTVLLTSFSVPALGEDPIYVLDN
jgi:hypothetical protein